MKNHNNEIVIILKQHRLYLKQAQNSKQIKSQLLLATLKPGDLVNIKYRIDQPQKFWII